MELRVRELILAENMRLVPSTPMEAYTSLYLQLYNILCLLNSTSTRHACSSHTQIQAKHIYT